MVKRLSPTDQNNVALINVPTPTADGDAANKSYVDGKSYPTNLTTTTAASTVTVVSDTGTDATIPAATTSVAGVMSGTDKTKLNGIAAGAEVNEVSSVDLDGKADVNHNHALADIVTTGIADDTTYLRGDGAWTEIGPKITSSATAPSNPSIGDIWIDLS